MTVENITNNSIVPVENTTNNANVKAQEKKYVQDNLLYLQRRIKEKLIYPAQAKRTGIQGTVEIRFRIHLDGSVSDIRVMRSSGSTLLDEAAAETIRKAAPFRPPSVQTTLVIPIVFSLR